MLIYDIRPSLVAGKGIPVGSPDDFENNRHLFAEFREENRIVDLKNNKYITLKYITEDKVKEFPRFECKI